MTPAESQCERRAPNTCAFYSIASDRALPEVRSNDEDISWILRRIKPSASRKKLQNAIASGLFQV